MDDKNKLFDGYEFRILGLSLERENEFYKILKSLGANFPNATKKYTLVTECFEKHGYKHCESHPSYRMAYIFDCMEKNKMLNIEEYKFIDTPYCYFAHYVYGVDSCANYYWKNVQLRQGNCPYKESCSCQKHNNLEQNSNPNSTSPNVARTSRINKEYNHEEALNSEPASYYFTSNQNLNSQSLDSNVQNNQIPSPYSDDYEIIKREPESIVFSQLLSQNLFDSQTQVTSEKSNDHNNSLSNDLNERRSNQPVSLQESEEGYQDFQTAIDTSDHEESSSNPPNDRNIKNNKRVPHLSLSSLSSKNKETTVDNSKNRTKNSTKTKESAQSDLHANQKSQASNSNDNQETEASNSHKDSTENNLNSKHKKNCHSINDRSMSIVQNGQICNSESPPQVSPDTASLCLSTPSVIAEQRIASSDIDKTLSGDDITILKTDELVNKKKKSLNNKYFKQKDSNESHNSSLRIFENLKNSNHTPSKKNTWSSTHNEKSDESEDENFDRFVNQRNTKIKRLNKNDGTLKSKPLKSLNDIHQASSSKVAQFVNLSSDEDCQSPSLLQNCRKRIINNHDSDADSDSSKKQKTDDSSEDSIQEPEDEKKYMICEYLPPKRDRCRAPGCSISKTPHERHGLITKYFSNYEHKIMIIYLIKNNAISMARGLDIWKNMIYENFLTHRKFYSLNSTFRKKILPNIHDFNLPPHIENEFTALKYSSDGD